MDLYSIYIFYLYSGEREIYISYIFYMNLYESIWFFDVL